MNGGYIFLRLLFSFSILTLPSLSRSLSLFLSRPLLYLALADFAGVAGIGPPTA